MLVVQLFPFDVQVLPIIFESFHFKACDMQMYMLPKQMRQRPSADGTWAAMSADVKLMEWTPAGIDAFVAENHYDFEDRSYSRAVVHVHLARKPMYYFSKILFMVSYGRLSVIACVQAMGVGAGGTDGCDGCWCRLY